MSGISTRLLLGAAALGAATVLAVADPTPAPRPARPRPRVLSFGQEDLKRYQTPTPKAGSTPVPSSEDAASSSGNSGHTAPAPHPTASGKPKYRPFWRPPTPDPNAGKYSETSPKVPTDPPPPTPVVTGETYACPNCAEPRPKGSKTCPSCGLP